MAKRSGSSQRWLQRHVRDPYVQRAQAEGYRARSAYKLIEIDSRHRLLRSGQRIVDLGAAPGGWSQVAAHKAEPGGRVIAVDLLPIAPISGVMVIEGDLRKPETRAQVLAALDGDPAQVVLCDLSPNLSGIASVDQASGVRLAEIALTVCEQVLAEDGTVLVKAFQGEAFSEIRSLLQERFRSVSTCKPAASRGGSRETYLLGRGLTRIVRRIEPAG